MDSTSVVDVGRPAVRRGTLAQFLRGSLKGAEYTWAVAFVVPYIAVFVTFVAYPIVYGVWMGSEASLYRELFADPIYQTTVVNTVLYLALGVNVKMFLALLLSGFFMRPGWWMKLPDSSRARNIRSEEHTSELQSLTNLVCRLLLEKKKQKTK